MKIALKVVITSVEDGEKRSAIVGVSRPDCDPVVTVVGGRLEEALPQVPALVTAALARWERAPKNPATAFKPPPSPPASQRRVAAPTGPVTGPSASSPPHGQAAKFF